MKLDACWFFSSWNLHIEFFLLFKTIFFMELDPADLCLWNVLSADFSSWNLLHADFGTCCMLIYVRGTCWVIIFFLFVKLVASCFFSVHKICILIFHLVKLILLMELVACWLLFFSSWNLLHAVFLFVKLVAWLLFLFVKHVHWFSPREPDYIHGTGCLLIFSMKLVAFCFFSSWNFFSSRMFFFMEIVACWFVFVELVECYFFVKRFVCWFLSS
jgi:hypothetical protein